MIRRTLGALMLLTVFVPAAAAQGVVGHLPTQSPFQDLSGRHMYSLQPAWLMTAKDPANVGPGSGFMLMARYEYDFAGPLMLTARSGFAPGLERRVVDPMMSGNLRNAGTRTEPLFLLDGGLALSLTGDKAWRGINPRVHTEIGMVSSLKSNYDVGGYRFGPKMVWSWGLQTRGVRTGAFEWNADVTWAWWRMQYPGIYKDSVALSDGPVLDRGRLNPWNGNVILSIGVTRVYGR